jgi:benzodiazapine receptor
MPSKRLILLLALNIILFAVTVGVNSLAGATTLLNGKTTGQVSDSYPTLITPQGFTFAIWGVIYILLAFFVVYQVLPRNRDKLFHERISFLFILSCLLNIAWIFLWQYGLFAYSVIFIFGLLGSLIAIYLRLRIGKSAAPLRERICVQLPFSVYMGWITIASIANVAIALTAAGWNGFGIAPSTGAAIVITIALIITLVVIATRKDVAYSLVIAWALYGIMSKQSGNQTVFWATGIGIIVILLALAVAITASGMKKQR